jgi:hypothetical protein
MAFVVAQLVDPRLRFLCCLLQAGDISQSVASFDQRIETINLIRQRDFDGLVVRFCRFCSGDTSEFGGGAVVAGSTAGASGNPLLTLFFPSITTM